MLDEMEFEEIKERFEAFDAKREAIIKESRDILKLSKQAIFSIHRDDLEKAKAQLGDAEALKKKLEKSVAADPSLRTGGFCNAVEEYVEAKTFLHFLEKGTILPMKRLKVTPEEYLGGLADLTGELCRRAVILATKKQVVDVEQIHQAVESIYGQFVKFDFRNGDLRRKYDAIKYNLQKVENVLYDLGMKA
jgi:predicted translin family RNA/ssDNA-binding protein